MKKKRVNGRRAKRDGTSPPEVEWEPKGWQGEGGDGSVQGSGVRGG